jgi:hypothetical protein
MKKRLLNIILFLIIFSSLTFAKNNNLIFGVGINHNFSSNTATGKKLNNYSLALQYYYSLNKYFSLGLKGMIDNPIPLSENSTEEKNVLFPLFITINQSLLSGFSYVVYMQLGAGAVFNFGGGHESSEFLNTALAL